MDVGSLDVLAQTLRIGAVSRLLCLIGACVLALAPAAALAAPTPSPSLDGVLAAPPATDYSELTTYGVFAEPLDANGYVTISVTPEPTNDQKTMEADGFLSGFGKTWLQKTKNHVLVEAVLAFNGGKGATSWMRQAETADKGLASYKSALTVSGVADYYGAHLFDATSGLYSDGFVVVKGNDAFLIVFASRADDLGDTATTQAKKQFDGAPSATIPQSDWPETKAANTASNVIKVAGGVIGVVIILAVLLVTGLVVRSRRRPAMQPAYVQGGYPAAAAVPASAVQMSEDRHSWWDGTAWRDAEHEVPPGAQRSTDGQFWWDGAAWRPIPASPPA
jgi:hypothetical protein